MQLQHLTYILFAGSLARAAPSPVAARGPPLISSLGSLQVLKYNDLSAENNGTAAVLVYDRLDQSKAQARCAAIGEKLYTFQASDSDLQYQIDYLVFSGSLQPNDLLWASEGSSQGCFAYSHSQKAVVSAPCDSQLPAICTTSVPPTTETNRATIESSKVSISYDGYSVTGYRDARSFRFLGLPFANPPVKNLRFAPPQPYTGRRNIDATKMAPACIQSPSRFGVVDGSISEDCLYLNVFTPVLSPPEGSRIPSKPVAVYFYGGSFTEGSASLIDYDGGNFASRNDVVVVTVNYRVGALGFLTIGNHTTGNYGTRDQIMALQWVKKNIAAFGGDPSRVTIFGQSAGGQSVVALLSSSAAKGLFSAAISQSAPIDLPWFTRDVYNEIYVPEIAPAVGCNGTLSEKGLLSCLRSVPATNYLDNSTAFENAMKSITSKVSSGYLHVSSLIAQAEKIMPMVDDTGSGVVDDQFYKLLARRTVPNRVPTMFTTVTNEAFFYGDSVPSLGSKESILDAILNFAYTPELATNMINSGAFEGNLSDPDRVRDVALDAMTLSEWTCPEAYLLSHGGQYAFPSLYEVEISQGHSQTDVDVPSACLPNNKFNASCHTSDVLLVWGTLNSKTQDVQPYFDQVDHLHSQLLNDVFGSFFRTYSPNPDPAYLQVRGPAYATSYDIFVQNQYRIQNYNPQASNINLLEMPPGWVENPGLSKKCAIFNDYGYTFQHANLTIS